MKAHDGWEVLLEAMTTGDSSSAIMNQEKRGQQDFNSSDVLPKECLHCTREQLEALGIVFGDNVDDLFIQAKLPDGWKKVATDHSMWTDLVDNKDRVRAHIFYKAAFYDRSAHIGLSRRYSADYQPVGGYSGSGDSKEWEGVVTDCGETIWKTDPVIKVSYNDTDTVYEQAKNWLEEHYPEHKDYLAYWD